MRSVLPNQGCTGATQGESKTYMPGPQPLALNQQDESDAQACAAYKSSSLDSALTEDLAQNHDLLNDLDHWATRTTPVSSCGQVLSN